MAHRPEIESLYKDEIQDLKAILTCTLPGATRSGRRQPEKPRQSSPSLRTLITLPVSSSPQRYTSDPRGSDAGENLREFEGGEDLILLGPLPL